MQRTSIPDKVKADTALTGTQGCKGSGNEILAVQAIQHKDTLELWQKGDQSSVGDQDHAGEGVQQARGAIWLRTQIRMRAQSSFWC